MKAAVIAIGLVVAARPADACGVPDFGAMLADVAKALDPQTEAVHTPVISVGGGLSTDGPALTVLVGFGWGERDKAGMFAGTTLERVLVGVRRDPDARSLSLTYGIYQTHFGSGGLDAGVEHQLADGTTGPIARLTVGAAGIAARLGGGVMFGADTPSSAGVVVVEVMDLVKRSRSGTRSRPGGRGYRPRRPASRGRSAARPSCPCSA